MKTFHALRFSLFFLSLQSIIISSDLNKPQEQKYQKRNLYTGETGPIFGRGGNWGLGEDWSEGLPVAYDFFTQKELTKIRPSIITSIQMTQKSQTSKSEKDTNKNCSVDGRLTSMRQRSMSKEVQDEKLYTLEELLQEKKVLDESEQGK